ncbi:hypothetical protein C8J56DRAFT_885616 [Mycena floridula]|nr:hypothetical protein C8J56DRAFT_885616 [Mycena floridula]
MTRESIWLASMSKVIAGAYEQGWKGSAKTRLLVLAVRDYLVERVTRSKIGAEKLPLSADEDKDDISQVMGTPLEDEWVVDHLQVRRLRLLQQAFDADGSGFTTIAEINDFTKARPEHCSLPRWISFWAVGWQICATQYCAEIERIFAQMCLIRTQIGIKMPGNLQYISGYIDRAWLIVTPLTMGLQRFEWAPRSLEERYEALNMNQETILAERLNYIEYNIDDIKTVTVVTGRGEVRLETEEVVQNDTDTITYVIMAAWQRFEHLTELFKSQNVMDNMMEQTFDWFSAGLVESPLRDLTFKKYFEWKHWFNTAAFTKTDPLIWCAVSSEIDQVDDATLDSLIWTIDRVNTKGQSQIAKPSVSQVLESFEPELNGTWYGFQWDEMTNTLLPMQCLVIEGQKRVMQGLPIPEDTAEIQLAVTVSELHEFEGTWSIGESMTKIGGRMQAKPISPASPTGNSEVSVSRISSDGSYINYHGVLRENDSMIIGDVRGIYVPWEKDRYEGPFIFLRTSKPESLCYHPFRLISRPGQPSWWSFLRDIFLRRIRQPSSIMRYFELTYRGERAMLTALENEELCSFRQSFPFFQSSALYDCYHWHVQIELTNTLSGASSFATTVPVRDIPLLKDLYSIRCMARDGIMNAHGEYQSTVDGNSDENGENAMSNPEMTSFNEHQHGTPISASNGLEAESAFTEKRSMSLCLTCNTSVLAPCWYCLECMANIPGRFICDKCEDDIEELVPWEFQKQYRAEVAKGIGHNLFHPQIRFRTDSKTTSEENEESKASPTVSTDSNSGQWEHHLELLEERMSRNLDKGLKEMESRISAKLDMLFSGRS